MAQDIFGREVDLGTPLAADATRLIIAGLTDEDMMAQNVQLQYQQNINRVWEVGSSKVYFIAGRTEGSCVVDRIIGAKGISGSFISDYGNVCNMAGNNITLAFGNGCTGSSQASSIQAKHVVIKSIAYRVAAADMIINENIAMLFAMIEGL